MSRVSFFIHGAIDSKYNAEHWFRYLRKIIKDGKIILRPDEIDELLKSRELTIFQKVALKRAIIPDSLTHLYLKRLNEPYKPRLQSLNQVPLANICKIIHKETNPMGKILALDYVAGMELHSASENDIEDVVQIILHDKIKDIEQFKSAIKGYDFSVDESLFIEVFGVAYGMNWIEKYYIAQESKVIDAVSKNFLFSNTFKKV